MIIYKSGVTPLFLPTNDSLNALSMRVTHTLPRRNFISINGLPRQEVRNQDFIPDDCPRMLLSIPYEQNLTRICEAAAIRVRPYDGKVGTDPRLLLNYRELLKREDSPLQLYNVEVSLDEINLYFWHDGYKATLNLVLDSEFSGGITFYAPAIFHKSVTRHRVMVETCARTVERAPGMYEKVPYRLLRFSKTWPEGSPESETRSEPDFSLEISQSMDNPQKVTFAYEIKGYELSLDGIRALMDTYSTEYVSLPL